MRRAHKFRLFTNATQERGFEAMLETHRRLYNDCLEQRKSFWETDGTSVSFYDQSAWFTAARHANPFFARLNVSSARGTMRRLDRAFVAFFRRCKSGEKPGYPRFKPRERFDSVEFPAYGNGIRLNGNRLYVQHVGTIRCKAHREVKGTIKTATLKREASKWYVVLSCDLGERQVAPSTLPPGGLDVGLERFATASDGEVVANPRFLKKELSALKRAQRSMCRKKKGGRNRRKAKKELAARHARVANRRRDHHHKTALSLIRRFGFIAVENLDILGMLEDHRYSRAIADAGWGDQFAILRHKAESAGVTVVEVDPRGTSQVCSGCGADVPKGIRVRRHDCPYCGLSLHRDENASRNILARGLEDPRGVAWLQANFHDRDCVLDPVGLKHILGRSGRPGRGLRAETGNGPSPEKPLASASGVVTS
jgi:putative transposase